MAIHETVTLEMTLAYLNEVATLDPQAMYQLIEARVPCNEALANHPTVQVVAGPDGVGPYQVGFLGILCGMFGTCSDGWSPIEAVIEDDGTVRFQRHEASRS